MRQTPPYVATACTGCRRASLIVQSDSLDAVCPRCGAERLLAAGAEYSFDDVALFTALDTVVHEAELTGTAAARVAAELESVGEKWEPPELALDRVAQHLPRLRGCYSPRQDYEQLLEIVSMLLTIVGPRLDAPGVARAQRRSESGILPRVEDPSGPTGALGTRKVYG
jgi:hypothetical protein